MNYSIFFAVYQYTAVYTKVFLTFTKTVIKLLADMKQKVHWKLKEKKTLFTKKKNLWMNVGKL